MTAQELYEKFAAGHTGRLRPHPWWALASDEQDQWIRLADHIGLVAQSHEDELEAARREGFNDGYEQAEEDFEDFTP